MPTGPLIAGRYEILAEIGRGGMGVVARAYDHRLDTEVAIKVLRQDLAKDSGDKDSLIKEARVLARLTHPSIVRLFDLAETEVGLMLVLEYVRGPNLAQVLESRGRLTPSEFLHVARQTCAGLAAAHAEGVIHRDLKPPNLLVAPSLPEATGPDFLLNSRIKITDFGISKLLSSKIQTASGVATTTTAGTPVFMAPEQFSGQPCTPATDIYALGIITYLALSGRPPFIAESVRELAFQHFHATAPSIPECSPQVNAVIQRALAKVPGERYRSAPEFLAALEAAYAPPPLPVYVEPPLLEPDSLDRAASWLGRHWWKLGLGFVAIVTSAIYLAIQYIPRTPPAPFGPIWEGKPLSLGQIIDLPPDLDPVPVAASLPPPIIAPAAPSAHAGPRKAPHAIWTALIDSSGFHSSAMVDGVSLDGTVYIRDEGTKNLWAITGSALKWGYRAAEPPNLAKVGLHMPQWPDHSHVDFRDPGRVWLASCPDAKGACDGVVFNSEGKGGRNSQVPVELRVPPAPLLPASSDFREDDTQNGHWPDEHPQLRYNSRLGSVMLTGIEQGWTIPMNARPAKAVRGNGRFILVTVRDTVYAIDSKGRIEWTYASPSPVQSIEELPSGDVLLLSGKDRDSLQTIRSGNKQWEFNAHAWIRDFGPLDQTGVLYFAATAGNNVVLHALEPDGKPLWSLPWTASRTSGESLYLDNTGRLFLSNGGFEVDGKARKGVVCLVE